MTKAFKIIKCVDILSNAKLSGKMFRFYLDCRKIARPILEDRQEAIVKFQKDWSDKSAEGYKDAENGLNDYVKVLYEQNVEVPNCDLSVDDIVSTLEGTNVTNEEAALLCEVIGL